MTTKTFWCISDEPPTKGNRMTETDYKKKIAHAADFMNLGLYSNATCTIAEVAVESGKYPHVIGMDFALELRDLEARIREARAKKETVS